MHLYCVIFVIFVVSTFERTHRYFASPIMICQNLLNMPQVTKVHGIIDCASSIVHMDGDPPIGTQAANYNGIASICRTSKYKRLLIEQRKQVQSIKMSYKALLKMIRSFDSCVFTTHTERVQVV